MTPLLWFARDQQAAQLLGFIPDFLDADDERPAAEQFNERYAHGGGWRPLKGFKLDGATLIYPGSEETEDEPAWPDEVYPPIAWAVLPATHEAIVVYEGAFVVIAPPDGNWQVARLD